MEESRIIPGILRKKPKVVLDKRFPFVQSLNVGDKGQLDAVLEIESFELRMDDDDNEMKYITLGIVKAERLDIPGVRL